MEIQVAGGKGFDKNEILLLYRGGHPKFLIRYGQTTVADTQVVLSVGEDAVSIESYKIVIPSVKETIKRLGWRDSFNTRLWREAIKPRVEREPMFRIPYDKIVKCEISADSALETTTVTRSPRGDMISGVKGSVTTSMEDILVIEVKAHKGGKEVTIPITFTRIFGYMGGRMLTTSTREKLNDIMVQIHIKMNEVNPVTLDF